MSNSIMRAVLFATCVFSWALLGCSEFPEARQLEAAKPEKTIMATAIPAGRDYESLIGKVIEVEGVITRILNKGGTPTILLDDAVVCAFGPEYLNINGRFSVGDKVVVRGEVAFVSATTRFKGYLSPAMVVRKRAP